MTTTKKAVQANYTNEMLAAIIAAYKKGREGGLDNGAILTDLAKKYGKTVPSIRAKLASLKVYQKDIDTLASVSPSKAKKGDIVEGLETLTGLNLASFESCNKAELSAMAEYIDELLSTIHELKGRL